MLKDELLGLAGDPNGDPIFKNQHLDMDVLYRTGETLQVELFYLNSYRTRRFLNFLYYSCNLNCLFIIITIIIIFFWGWEWMRYLICFYVPNLGIFLLFVLYHI